MFGLHTFLPSIVRRQRFLNYGHEEMRGDSPQYICLNVSTIQCSIRIFLFEKKNISYNTRKMSGKI